jgi:hypothetical protein
VADTISERSHHNTEGARDALNFFTYVGKNLVSLALWAFTASGWAKIDIEFGCANRHDMVTAFGSAETASDFVDLRNTEELLLDDICDVVSFL